MTGDEPAIYVDPSLPKGVGYVYRRGTGGALEDAVPARFALARADELKSVDLDGIGERWAKLAMQARSPGLALRATLPLQQPTLDAFTRAAGKASTQVKLFADILGNALGKRQRSRAVRPVPPVVPPGLSRVDSARARSARSALLRTRRRALRHNRALPRPRARIFVTDPKITWEDPKRVPHDDRVDATLYALHALAARPSGS